MRGRRLSAHRIDVDASRQRVSVWCVQRHRESEEAVKTRKKANRSKHNARVRAMRKKMTAEIRDTEKKAGRKSGGKP